MADVLLIVSGQIAPDLAEQIARGTRHRVDFIEMAQAFDADLLDDAEAQRSTGLFGRLLERIGGPNLVLAWACFRRSTHYKVIFGHGEQVGIPLAVLLKFAGWNARRPRHFMITHDILATKKLLFFKLLGIQSHVDRMFVYTSGHKSFVQEHGYMPAERVVLTSCMVDSRFFSLEKAVQNQASRPAICSVGIEARDYPTMMKAVDGLDVDVTIAASSPWSKRADSSANQHVPANVTINRDPKCDIRQLYADSAFVVMPLDNVNRAAGSTTILEAMSMERAVICSRAIGQTDLVVDGETGMYVPPGDVQALRKAIEYLLNHPEEAQRMGNAGRRRVEQEFSLECSVERLAQQVRDAVRE